MARAIFHAKIRGKLLALRDSRGRMRRLARDPLLAKDPPSRRGVFPLSHMCATLVQRLRVIQRPFEALSPLCLGPIAPQWSLELVRGEEMEAMETN